VNYFSSYGSQVTSLVTAISDHEWDDLTNTLLYQALRSLYEKDLGTVAHGDNHKGNFPAGVTDWFARISQKRFEQVLFYEGARALQCTGSCVNIASQTFISKQKATEIRLYLMFTVTFRRILLPNKKARWSVEWSNKHN